MSRIPSSHSPVSQLPSPCLAYRYQQRSKNSHPKKTQNKGGKIESAPIELFFNKGNYIMIKITDVNINVPIKCFKILLLPYLKKDFHGVSVIINLSKT